MNPERDEKDDAKARGRALIARLRAEVGLLRDDSETLRLRLEQERRDD